MSRHTSSVHIVCSFVLGLILSLSIFADTIRLKDGSLIKGTIVSFADGRFIVAVGEGSRRRELTLEAAEIASIQFDDRNSSSAANNQSTRNSTVIPVSTRPAPKLVVTDNAKTSNPPKDGQRTVVETDKPVNAEPPKTKAAQPTVSPTGRSAAAVTPISLNVHVLADNTANGWTNSGWVVKKGQRIHITATGSVSLGRAVTSTPSGLSDLEDDQKLLKSVPTGALLAVIGDDNNDFIYVGAEREFTAARDGVLYLGVNEGNLNDNSGAFEARIEIFPSE
jgi:hypothetical protein